MPGPAECAVVPGELDAAALERLYALDPTGQNQLFERLIEAFSLTLQRMLPQLGRAAVECDLVTLRHVAHTLKSSSAHIGALHLSRLCAELELQARHGWVDAPRDCARDITAEVLAVERALRRLPTEARG